jgi:hypothetical protein
MAYIGITTGQDSEQLSSTYIGFPSTIERPTTSLVVDTFTGTGTQRVFPLSNPKPVSSRSILVSVDGYNLAPVIDYNLDQYFNLELTTAPVSGAPIIVHHLVFPKNEATSSIRKLDDISSQFDGTTTRFTLTANGQAANILGQNVLIVSVNGVIQEPGESYTLTGDDIIFSEAPVSTSSFYGIDIGTTGIGTPGDETVTVEKLLTTNTPDNGQVLAVDSQGNLTWTTPINGTGAVDLSGLSDVTVTAPVNGQVLKYNGTEFVNINLSWAEIANKPTFSTVAVTGSYGSLLNKPSIPSDIGDLADAGNLLFSGNYNDLTDAPPREHQLADSTDVVVDQPQVNDVLIYDGVKWINDSLTVTDLGVAAGELGQVLTVAVNGTYEFKDAAYPPNSRSSLARANNQSAVELENIRVRINSTTRRLELSAVSSETNVLVNTMVNKVGTLPAVVANNGLVVGSWAVDSTTWYDLGIEFETDGDTAISTVSDLDLGTMYRITVQRIALDNSNISIEKLA